MKRRILGKRRYNVCKRVGGASLCVSLVVSGVYLSWVVVQMYSQVSIECPLNLYLPGSIQKVIGCVCVCVCWMGNKKVKNFGVFFL